MTKEDRMKAFYFPQMLVDPPTGPLLVTVATLMHRTLITGSEQNQFTALIILTL